MSKHHHKHHICCERKVRHETKDYATIALKKLNQEYGYIAYVYYCRRCQGWHIGKASARSNPVVFWHNLEIKMKLRENENNMTNNVNEITIICPNCKKEIKIDDNILNNYYNWKCDICYSFIQLKGNIMAIWHCNTGTPKRKGR